VRHPLDPPPSFTDAQHQIIETFASLIPVSERAVYLAAVDARFGPGTPGTACVSAAKVYISLEELRARGLAPLLTRAKKKDDEQDETSEHG